MHEKRISLPKNFQIFSNNYLSLFFLIFDCSEFYQFVKKLSFIDLPGLFYYFSSNFTIL